jgi:fatty-acyl-CoA synthase
MTTLQLGETADFDAGAFTAFVDGESGLPSRWRPTFVRVARDVAVTPTNKVLKRLLRREKFRIDRFSDRVFWRPRGADAFRPFEPGDLAALRQRFQRAGHADKFDE